MNPSGPVTFLFTDVEGSTTLWEHHPNEMQRALARHDEVLRSAIVDNGGSVFSTAGDAFAAAFDRPAYAAAAAASIQERLAGEQWPTPTPIKVRVGIHTGTAEERGGDYFGPTLNRTARLMAVAHGGQIVCSSVVADAVRADETVTLIELGEHRLKDLLDPMLIYQVGPGQFPELRSAGGALAGLPQQRSPLVGRSDELKRLLESIGPGRLVTLVGPGGIGKTRLAIQAAAEVAESAQGGALLVDLSAATDVASMWSAITHALDLAPQGAEDITGRLVAALRVRRRILVWDNCEQVVSDAAEVLASILRGAPGTTLLATSLEPLDIEDETVVRVGPLGQADAVALLVQRARRADVSLDGSAASVETLSRALDGIPLAIELAATRLRSVPLQEMAGLTSELLALLDSPGRGRPERQRTLRTAIEWSLALLPERTRSVYSQLSVLTGSFDARAAASVCDMAPVQALGELSELVDKSMLEFGPDSRYRLLEPLRLYGRDMLAEDVSLNELVRARHASHFAARAREVSPLLTSAEHHKASEEIFQDLSNYTSALQWALDSGDPAAAASLFADLGWYWYYSGSFVEGIAWATRCLEAIESVTGLGATAARCESALARLLFYRGDVPAARQRAISAVATARAADGALSELGDALIMATVTAQAMGDLAALDSATEAIEIFRSTGDEWRLATASFYLGVSGVFLGRPDLAGPALDEAAELFDGLGDIWGLGGVTFYRGVLASGSGDMDEARRLVARSVDQLRLSGDRWRLMFALGTQSGLEEGESAEAARAEGDRLRTELGLGG